MTMKNVSWWMLMCAMFVFASCQSKANDETPPNILFCIADDATWEHMSAYGCQWVQTPSFDRVAAEGLLFTNAYTPNAKCAPSRATILTGRNSWQLEEAGNHLAYFPSKFKTYAEALHEAGYKVGYTGKGWAPGDAGQKDGKKRDLLVKAYNKLKKKAPTKAISSTDYVANFEMFLNERQQGEPFCFWYGGHEPHRKYEYGSGIRLGNKNLAQIDSVFSYWPDSDTVRTDMLDYAFELEYFDQQLGKMLHVLKEAGELDNTLVVVTSDNGMPFPRVKGQKYEHSNHLPLAIMWKDGIRKPGRVVDDYVSFIDFAATFLDVAGYSDSELGLEPIEGISLRYAFESTKTKQIDPKRNYVLIGKERHDVGRPNNWGYPVRGIVKEGYLYLHNYKTDRWPAGNPETGYTNTDGSPTKTLILNNRRTGKDTLLWQLNFGRRVEEELYCIAEDEDCMNNLAKDPNFAKLKAGLKELMESELRRQNDPRILGKGEVFDEYEPTNGSHFYEKYFAGEKVHFGWIKETDFEKEVIVDE
jgi:arylsulfatase A-like enzyme